MSSEDLQQKVDKNESGVVQETAADVRRDVPVTTVWNSAHVAEQKELLEGVRFFRISSALFTHASIV